MTAGVLAVLIPTRNRSDLATAAVRSVTESGDANIRVIVSDNSTDVAETRKLEQFHSNLGDPRLSVIRPKAPLSMTKHWDWAIEQVLADRSVTHALVLADRMMFKRGALDAVVRVVADYPDDVIMYADDKVIDDDEPVAVVKVRWRGVLARVSTRRLLQMTSQGQLFPVPRMLNSVAPRAALETVRRRFGTIFGSASPDFCFAYRCLAVTDTVLYYDRAPVFHYALRVSNGFAFARGERTAASEDYLRTIGEPPTAFAPVPEIITPNNAVISEYCRVREETASDKFPPMNRDRYLQLISADIARIRVPELRRQMESALAAHGRPASRPSLLTFLKRVLSLPAAGPMRRFWRFLSRTANLNPPGDAPITFANSDQAIAHMRTVPRRRHMTSLHLRVLFGTYERLGRY